MTPELPLIDALESIMEWRKKALAYDADANHEPRTFCEDVELIEQAAKRALDIYNAMLGSTSPEAADRDAIIEQCAMVAEDEWVSANSLCRSKAGKDIAAAIRILKARGPQPSVSK